MRYGTAMSEPIRQSAVARSSAGYPVAQMRLSARQVIGLAAGGVAMLATIGGATLSFHASYLEVRNDTDRNAEAIVELRKDQEATYRELMATLKGMQKTDIEQQKVLERLLERSESQRDRMDRMDGE